MNKINLLVKNADLIRRIHDGWSWWCIYFELKAKRELVLVYKSLLFLVSVLHRPHVRDVFGIVRIHQVNIHLDVFMPEVHDGFGVLTLIMKPVSTRIGWIWLFLYWYTYKSFGKFENCTCVAVGMTANVDCFASFGLTIQYTSISVFSPCWMTYAIWLLQFCKVEWLTVGLGKVFNKSSSKE